MSFKENCCAFFSLIVVLFSVTFLYCPKSQAQEFKYPLAWSLEDFHHVNLYASDTGMGGGGEFAFYGSAKKHILNYIGLKAPDLYIGLTINQNRQSALYAAPSGKIFTGLGLGTGVKAFLRYRGSDGFGLTTALYGFYHVPKILFPYEWLVIYIGFKSDESNFHKESWEKVFKKAYNLFGSDAPIIYGFYYTWDLANLYAIGFETDLTNFMLLFSFGKGSFL